MTQTANYARPVALLLLGLLAAWAQAEPHVWPCSYPTGLEDEEANGGVVLQCGDGHLVVPRLYSHVVQHNFEECLMWFQAHDGFVTTDTTIPLCLTMALDKCVDQSGDLADMTRRCGKP